MYVSIGPNAVVRRDEMIGVFDMDNATWSARTRKSMTVCEREGRVVSVGEDLPRAIVVCSPAKRERQRRRRTGERRKGTLYLTQLSAQTIEKRVESEQI